MNAQTITTVVVEGVHYWPNCTIDEVGYLSHPHRHLFKIKAFCKVNHDDRDVEFILLGHQIKHYLAVKYWNKNLELLNFGSLSCESIGKEILKVFGGIWAVEVWEDDENGARVER